MVSESNVFIDIYWCDSIFAVVMGGDLVASGLNVSLRLNGLARQCHFWISQAFLTLDINPFLA